MFCRLILAHLVGDFVLQTHWIVKRKCRLEGLALHVGLVGLAMLPVTWERLDRWWPWLLLITLAHGLIDWAKIRLQPRLPWPPIVPFLADQALHVLTIVAVLALSGDLDAGWPWEQEPTWWIASVYLIGTCALSVALPLSLSPRVTQRPATLRPIIILASALAMTLTWRGLPLLVPVMGMGLYQVLIVRRLAHTPATETFDVEFWGALLMAASLGWGLP